MSTFDEPEYRRWMGTDDSHLAAARHNIGAADHVAVLMAEQAVQCAMKAMLHAVGSSRDARGHDLVDLLRLAGERSGLQFDDELRAAVITLSRDYQPTRYPDVLPGGTPAEHYTRHDAERATTVAQRALEAIKSHFEALRTEGGSTNQDASGGGPGGGR